MRYGNATRYNGRWPLALLVTLALAALAMLLLVQPAAAQNVDYDADEDGLIEIRNLAQLRAIDYDRNGDGLQGTETVPNWATHTAAFPNSVTNMGCPAAGCTGYELTADLDFDTDGSGSVGAGDDYPTGFRIGSYNAVLRGNGHSISNHYYRSTGPNHGSSRGLFDTFGSNARVHGLALLEVDVRDTGTGGTGHRLSGLVGENSGRITAVYVTGSIYSSNGDQVIGAIAGRNNGFIGASYSTAAITHSGGNNATPELGAIAGWNGGVINAVYNTGAVRATNRANRIGGLVGANEGSSSVVRASYSTGAVSFVHAGTNPGGAIGNTAGGAQAQNVYHDSQRSGQTDGGGYTTRQLRRPTDYSGIYADWNVDIDGDTMTDDDPWDFGTHRNYPLLRADFNSDGEATCEEFGNQPCYREPSPPPYNPQADHPEIYQNPRYEMATSCAVRTTGEGDDAVSTSTLTFDLGDYTRPLTLALSLWDGTHFRSLQSQNIAMPELRQEGQTATVEVVTDPAQTRFRIDSEYGLNLVLGYADCHTDDP